MIALKAENISKQYRLGEVGTGTLSHDLNRWWAKIRGKEDPFLKIGEANDRTAKGTSDYVWALNDINFEIEQGTAVGIIGRNGAGKSTLLKLLSKVTKPTTGRIYTKGRIASLLEVGTGFHPEMTGRENIYLNGAILGMTRKEITRKFDEIVAFAGIERYIDTPVKRYSSGMYVRLAFAVAAHLESEILIVDEVLAVGDIEFQKKCLGKMNEVSQGEGRTVLFVSHNMASVKKICTSGILIDNGKIKRMGAIDVIVDDYLVSTPNVSLVQNQNRKGTGIIRFIEFYVLDSKSSRVNTLSTGEDYLFCFNLKTNINNLQNVDVDFSIHTEEEEPLTVIQSSMCNKLYNFEKQGEYVVEFYIPKFNLSPGRKKVRGILTVNNEILDWPQDVLGTFDVIMGDFYGMGNLKYNKKIKILLDGKWMD